jgi:putative tricarboxylic transport membrane protein
MNREFVKRIFSHPDRISGATLVVAGAFLLYVASPLPFGHLKSPDTGFFPIILATMLCALGLLLFQQSFKTESFSLEMTTRSWAVLGTAAAFIFYALVVDRVGFLICTVALLLLLMKAYGGLSWKTSMLLSTGIAAVVYVGFNELGVPLPRGILGWF